MIKQKILIVEDDEISAGILSDYLKLHHYEVDLAHNGKDGLTLYSDMKMWHKNVLAIYLILVHMHQGS